MVMCCMQECLSPRHIPAGSGDIVDKNLKLILGLIWTLILHYQISIGFGIGDDKDKDGPTPRQALMGYLQVWT